MHKQKLVDILGIIILVGFIPLCFCAEFCPDACIYVLTSLLIMSGIRIYQFHCIPKNERRKYTHMNMFYGRDFLIHPYTQTGLVLIFFALDLCVRISSVLEK